MVEVELYESVNVTVSEKLIDRINKREINNFNCPKCGAKSELVYPFLYIDMKKKIWTWCYPMARRGDKDKIEEEILQIPDIIEILKMVGQPMPIVVFGYNELFVKIKKETYLPNQFEEGLRRGAQTAFIPKPLSIPDKPELDVFPFNVLFVQSTVKNGRNVIGSALYEPDFGSYKFVGNVRLMEYRDKYGPSSWLVIKYDTEKKIYMGQKYVQDKSTGTGFGVGWKNFFIQFTSLGLSNGEYCEIQEELGTTN